MLVQDLMTKDTVTCGPQDSLAVAANRLWSRDTGVLPIVEEGDHVVGMITDRDICMALAMRARPASAVRVSEVKNGPVVACEPTDEVDMVLDKMGKARVRRMPVLEKGHLVGMISLNDMILDARKAAGKEGHPRADHVFETLKSVSAHRGATA